MIYITEVILRMRDMCPTLARRVGGTASFDTALTMNADLGLPHAFVVPMEETAEAAEGNATAQRITERFSVVVCVDNKASREDGLGLTAADMVEKIRTELFNALMGWEPVQFNGAFPDPKPGYEDIWPKSRADYFRYAGGVHIDMNQGRLWHQFEFTCTYYDGPDCPDVATCKTTVAIASGAVNLYDSGTCKGNGTAVIYTVIGPDDTRYPPGHFSLDPETGEVTTNCPDGEYVVVWGYEPERNVPQEVYAEYYPYLLSLAGGDPEAITAEMYELASELPPDWTVQGFVNPDAGPLDPQHVFGKTRFAKEPETP